MVQRFVVALVLVVAAAPAARAEDACDTACRVEQVRAMLARGETAAARTQLLALYEETHLAELLFALGQVELQLEHYESAIDYYERFIATKPTDDQIALAQQAIGAARLQMATPKPKPEPPRPPPPPPPRPVYQRRWHAIDTVLVVAGGAAIAAGGALLFDANRIGNDTGGTLAEYDDRLEHAEFRRLAGVATAAGGAMLVGIALIRWRLDRTEVAPVPTTGGAIVQVSRRW